ncbi:phosphonate metabolism protein PhnM [Devosia limi DSM 17137]|uniref:Alpha-D-ribose 1-methylphosphonate 5-triphosphate diphosphatase n=1 Tax=Devosia limi DSM 17137 TaxID=1121477 RepID=A0A0F5LWL3_9HYPH|nr:alpha-D-ribose 1-methylphosphonate 5-triphosphate diphosphatase [Devosia limi]KKB86765.1 phosphonate metabolism protein PhnM [Devosia limi DSM 17137]SHF33824.1 alpha-D-ribose 1-methylphosphonate 5-triphosphate diphosphatase [Devosia limi DSM 17137]
MGETVFRNARIVVGDSIVTGSLKVEDGIITAIDSGVAKTGKDMDGDYLIPGLIELHTDHLENHYRPRPGVFWDPTAALHAHDVQIAGSGITTVFDAVRIGSDADMPEMGRHVDRLVNAIRAGRDEDRLRVEHLVHLRCELPSHDVVEQFEAYASDPITRLASVMDHTPGQRQFRSLEDYKRFYQAGRTAAELEAFVAARMAEHERYSGPNRRHIVKRANDLGLALASHDDATLAQVEEAEADGIKIAEFPTTLEAAAASRDAGIAILMGAPNVVRGKSHTGNISATDLVRAGLLDILSSDYVPFALLQAAFALPERVETLSLPQALALVTTNPAQAAGLNDRGVIAPGKRADLVRIEVIGGSPVVRGVWRQGKRVS